MFQQKETPADKRNSSAQVVAMTPIKGLLDGGLCAQLAGGQVRLAPSLAVCADV